MIEASVRESNDEVASSNTRTGESLTVVRVKTFKKKVKTLRIARAIATLCFSPPESLSPLSPTFSCLSDFEQRTHFTCVSYPLGQSSIES